MASKKEEEVVYKNEQDTSNALVLSARKKKRHSDDDTKDGEKKKKKLDARGRVKQPSKEKVLSKKRRKQLEKIAENKKKRANRSSLLQSLSEFQVSSSELGQFSSIAKMQNKIPANGEISKTKLNSIAGSNRGKAAAPEAPRQWQTGPYFETDSSSDSEPETTKPSTSKPTVNSDCKQEPDIEIILEENTQQTTGEDPEPDSTKPEVQPQPDTAKSEVQPPEPETTETQAKKPVCPAVHVPVQRTKEIQSARMALPIFAEEQAVVEAINDNQVVIICGETGSGKTTQVPQFLYEAGYATDGRRIGVTEPRRVAAVSMSRRVGHEMQLGEHIVSYQIRYEGNAGDETKIKFMTDGVLLKEMQRDIELKSYSVIIIDEAHERSMYSDILIGLLSRIVPLRHRKGDPLKLVVMSATLRVKDFTAGHLFRAPPVVLDVDSRQFRVELHHIRRTPENYLLEAYKRVCTIHRMHPDGGVLVFVSGQQEVHTLIRWLRRAFPVNNVQSEIEEKAPKRMKKKSKNKLKNAPRVHLDSYQMDDVLQRPDLNEAGVGDDLDIFDDFDATDADAQGVFEPSAEQPLYCLPLYSLLPSHKQSRVFSPPPPGCRLCVVATNVAETSLTIPDVKYVVDTGKEKVRLRDPVTGVSKFTVGWVSQASANQRAGRAGRVGPGLCFRLYSTPVFQDFAQFSVPDIMNKPVDELVLQMKAMNIIKVHNFPFPSAPDPDALAAAEQRLLRLGVLHGSQDGLSRVSSMGNTVSLFPVAPQFGKMLALANQHQLLPYAVCLVAALSVREPFLISSAKANLSKERMGEWLALRRTWCAKGQARMLGDLMVLLKAIGAAEFDGAKTEVCEKLGLRYKAVIEIRKLRNQLTNLINATCRLEESLVLDAKMQPPTDLQAKLLRQIVLAGLAENTAVRMDLIEENAPKGAYKTQTMKDPVYIHPASILFRESPDYVVYQELIQTTNKKYMTGLCSVEPEWLSVFAQTYCTFGSVLTDEVPFYDSSNDQIMHRVSCTFGASAWPLPPALVPHPVDTNLYRHFAVALLEGRVCAKLQQLKSKLLAAPQTMLKSWAKLQPRTEKLLNALVDRNISRKENLVEIWSSERDFLYKELCEWMPESEHDALLVIWPPID